MCCWCWWLLLLFPLAVLGFWMEARLEEQLLESKFGESYRTYARDKQRFIPRLPVRARCHRPPVVTGPSATFS